MVTMGQQTLLLPGIDDQETAARVRAFFDRDIPRLLNRAGRPISDLAARNWTPLGLVGWIRKWAGARTVDHLEAVEVYNAVVDVTIETVSLMRDDETHYYHRTSFGGLLY